MAAAVANLTQLAGIGAKTAERLQARGIESIEDLAFLLPKRYEDRRRRRRLDEVVDGEVAVIEATIRSFRQGYMRGRYLATLEVEQERDEGPPLRLKARWFHRVGGLPQRIEGGKKICLIGQVKWFRGECSMVHPEARDPEDPGPPIAVRYPEVEGIGQATLARYCRAATRHIASEASGFIDALPRPLVERHGLPGQVEALEYLHDPPTTLGDPELRALQAGTSPAHRRLAFDEFFFLQLALQRRRQEWRGGPAAIAPIAEALGDRERLRASVPFEPTGAQWRAIAEIEADMASGGPMLRLLQGDVGAGKTLVAFAACLTITAGGAQAAIMAPTEILAEQHLRTLTPWCRAAGIRIALLTGATPRAQRATTLALLGAGEIDLVVGTHALIVDEVAFRQLGLVVVDEQHRFGVEQRALLRDKGVAPHLLVMTATPIPRSLALTAYGELDVSILDEMPPGRIPPETALHTGKSGLERARAAIAARIREGIQAFVVCPLVEASEALDVTDVEATAAALRELLPGVEVGVIHGRMVSRDKDAVMTRFRGGELRVLVATTVIEVGVDVPEARAILIEHAERFGLAQLHQLRGRVGRGQERSWCILHTAAGKGSESAERLGVMVETCDGFQIAERDLEIRGPGEIFGTRQSGVPRLRYYGFAGEGTRLLVAARDAAERLLGEDPGLARHPEVAAELARRLAVQAIYSADAG
ncbi:MAG: ATP-dependent DNA helicase RecG [Myxococcales bacterium]|nr:ATP-dependent DNA helicase RecG [Myxococcales bacterium]